MTMTRLIKWLVWYKREIQVAWFKTKATILLSIDMMKKPKGTEFTIRGQKCNRVQYLIGVIPLIWK